MYVKRENFILIYFIDIDCFWMPWGEWTQCSAACGTGNRQRNRTKEVAELGKGICTGEPIESESCEGKECGKMIF